MFTLLHGDCLDELKSLDDCSIDSIVTDPPYGLSDHKPADVMACLSAWLAGEPYLTKKRGFMGKTWDSWVPGPEVWRECFRVLKPGGHILAFAGSRTHDLMSIALRLAGFECRDTVMYVYGSGFPKSLDVSKQIDKMAGAEREVVGVAGRSGSIRNSMAGDFAGGEYMATAPATESARQWQGWGTALKPAYEPVLLFRKPLAGTVAENVLKHGTGGINIDGCRIGNDVVGWGGAKGGSDDPTQSKGRNYRMGEGEPRPVAGRWPANFIHSGEDDAIAGLGEASRYFYCAKASKRDRDEGLEGFDVKSPSDKTGRKAGTIGLVGDTGNKGQTANPFANGGGVSRNAHPTVKPTDLMRYLCRLVTPPNGVILDPFMGSGSTGKAAMLEGFRFVGIEREAEYLEIAKARIAHASKGQGQLL